VIAFNVARDEEVIIVASFNILPSLKVTNEKDLLAIPMPDGRNIQ